MSARRSARVKTTTSKASKSKRVTSVKKTAGKKDKAPRVQERVKSGPSVTRVIAKHKRRLGGSIARNCKRVGIGQMSQDGKDVTEALYWNIGNAVVGLLPQMLGRKTKTVSVDHARGAIAVLAASSGSNAFGDEMILKGNESLNNYVQSLVAAEGQ